jgi:CRISPR system Cascade subunit CasE
MSALYLVRMPVDLSQLGRWAADRNLGWAERRRRDGQLRDAGFDEGCALHHLLSESYGKGVLQPFRLMVAPGGRASLYAYSAMDLKGLREAAAAFALPEAAGVCDPAQAATKLMPEEWKVGRRLAFDLRLRPVKRLMKPLAAATGVPIAVGSEVDAFLIEALRRFPSGANAEENMHAAGRSRETVYSGWLAERFGATAELVDGAVRLVRFARNRIARKKATPEGPDAVMHGELVIRDGEGFRHFLERGVGRHIAYGFGMLLLRPAGPH